MDKIDPFANISPSPTANRPLLGLTVLVIEDSLYACEAVRLLCLRSGARIRRADSMRSARKHLQVYRPTIAIIDVGLPDGSGLDLIDHLSSHKPRPQVILGTSGEADMKNAVMNAGADGFFEKPLTSLATFQETILSFLPQDRQPNGPRAVTDEEIHPDLIAFQDDIAHISELLEERRDNRTLDYVSQFLIGIAYSAQDHGLLNAAQALAQKRRQGSNASSEIATIIGLIQKRLSGRIAI